MHAIAAKAVTLKEAKGEEFIRYQEQVVRNARVLAETLLEMDFNLISGGTDNHLILVDLRNKNISGKDAETLLDEVGITVNKNAVPDDPESPFVTSGIRIGTPAITSRGMQEAEMKVIAELISQALEGQRSLIMAQIRRKVKELCASFLYMIFRTKGIFIMRPSWDSYFMEIAGLYHSVLPACAARSERLLKTSAF